MRRSARLVPLVVFLALLVGCSDSDDDDAGAGEPDPAGPPGNGPQAMPDPLITVDVQERLLEEVFGIYSGEAWDTMPLSLVRAAGGVEGVFAPTDSLTERPDGGAALVLVANCRTGSGRLEAQVPISSGNVAWQARLDACAPDPERTDLVLVSGRVDGVWNWHVSARSDELVWITAAGERVRFDGEMRREPSQSRQDDIAGFVTSNANQSVRDEADGALLRSIEEATSSRRIGSAFTRDTASLSGGFTYRSTGTDGRAVTARVPVELAYEWDWRTPAPEGVAAEDLGEAPLGDARDAPAGRTEEQQGAAQRARLRWAFTVGTLELQAEDGSRLVLDADTGDLDTVRITLDEGRGAGAEERVIDWPGSWYRALAPATLPSSRYAATAD